MRVEKQQELGRPQGFLDQYMGGIPYWKTRQANRNTKVGQPQALGGSDQSIVLGDGRADHVAGDCLGRRVPKADECLGEGTDRST
jgi:hypothetical protein